MHFDAVMLIDLIISQKRELENRLQEKYVERKIDPHWNLEDDLIKVISGPRRAGKSFFAMRLLARTGSYGYVNFDDERLAGLENYDEIVSAIQNVYSHPGYVLFDEVQNLPRWELFINRLQRQGLRLLITGSNANLLSSELATHLTGRYSATVLFPFSFAEYALFEGGEATGTEQQDMLNTYAEQGGYPEPLIKGVDRTDYLRTLVHATLYKDIIKRFKIRSVQGIEDLARYLMSNIGREYSLNALSGVTKCRSVHTIDNYIRYLQEAFLLFCVPRFSFKMKEQVGFNKKVFCTDNGLALAAGFRTSPDRGSLLENLVAIALHKSELAGRMTLFYWKSPQGEEVDFIVKQGLHVVQLIQVCSDISSPQTLKREMRSLVKASEALRCNDLLLLNDRADRTETFTWQGVSRRIRLMPLRQWLMNNP